MKTYSFKAHEIGTEVWTIKEFVYARKRKWEARKARITAAICVQMWAQQSVIYSLQFENNWDKYWHNPVSLTKEEAEKSL